MKKKIIFILVCMVLVSAFVLTACKESVNQDKIAGDYSDKTVTSNGGMAVTYGKYLYFVNGYAGQEGENVFGEAVKGAVVRVELDGDKLPVKGTEVIVVPKNVYFSSTNPTAGIYIYNDYIYYATTSVEKDSSGKYKTAKMVIMRTKVDGTETQDIITFDDHNAVYRVKGDYLLYVHSSKLYRINLSDKKFKETEIEEYIDSTYFFTSAEKASDNYIIYGANVDEKACIKVTSIDESLAPKVILNSDMFDPNVTNTITILKAVQNGDKINVFFKITDNLPNTPSLGIYYYTYDSSFGFDKAKMVRLTSNDSTTVGLNYSDFYFVENKIIAVATKTSGSSTVTKIDMMNADGTDKTELIAFAASITVKRIYTENNGLYCYYLDSNKLYRIKFCDIAQGGAITPIQMNSVLYFEGVLTSSAWATMEIINNVMYYWNGNISNVTYYLNLSGVKDRDADSRKTFRLGILTEADRIAAF